MDIVRLIIAEIAIKEDDVNKQHRILNSFENFQRETKKKAKEDDFEFENEKEIKEKCEIKINEIVIPFNYYYKFEKEGNYKIEYSFKGELTKLNHLFFG